TTIVKQPTLPFAIYPNPNHGSFTISTADSNFTGRIHICDVAGRAVYYNNHVSGATIHVTIPGAAAGVYFLTMQDISDPKTSRTINSYKIVVW
ncbi:MAG: T9SS type A sorting domain-containing protein, partial [Flavipsychrobacter sp.]